MTGMALLLGMQRYDRMHGLQLEHLAVDGCITKAPCGGESARPRPTATGDGLLAARLDTITMVGMLPERPVVHLDAGYDDQPCRQVLTERGMTGEIATRGQPAPIQASRRPRPEVSRRGPQWRPIQ